MPASRIEIALAPGFSSTFSSLEVRMIVGARGSLACSWGGEWGSGARERRKHDFGLDESAFQSVRAALARVPEPTWVVDDVPVRSIACEGPEGRVQRARFVMGPGSDADAHGAAFDLLWREVVGERVRPLLVELDVPRVVIDDICGSP